MGIANFAVVDELAAVNAEIERLNNRASELKAKIVASGFAVVESANYKAVVSVIEDSVSVNYKKVAEYLRDKVSAQVYGIGLKKASGVKKGYARVSLYDL